MWNAYLQGVFMGFSLILAIGAQNTFVLKQGLKQQHVFWVCLICALSDAILIALGVLGFGHWIQQHDVFTQLARYAGALFLLVYGVIHLKQAIQAGQSLQILQENSVNSLIKTCLTCLGFTWLNPHVYLDTVVLLGSISVKFHDMKAYFALGSMTASFLFFFSLGYGAKLLLRVFKSPRAWQILDVLIAIVMWGIALSLIFA
ncbi:amino acid transporter [Acinetobacter sp. LoGeW2-3]|uniref:LysE/ArgO family amino acid transporter n=1 Tax=Acinetobacter sp. LoGeW2-3 TaxID=1808001 RepID=UPI000C05A6A2|nr:LysE/ArgO family amino acid transporter [Acinetobacter sp. LoGeW2-3]ATO19937.1 amino acid transporter [Acinetobacter sp. LoGeW2-3]